MKSCFRFVLLFLPVFSFAQNINYGLPPFNREIKIALKDSGRMDERNLRTGFWVEYMLDSTEKKDYIQSMDAGFSSYPPYPVVIFKSIGNYKGGYREGEWKIYKSYDYTAPCHWDLEEIVNYKKGRYSGMWRYYSTSGKIIAEQNYKDGYQNGPYKKYYPNGKIQRYLPMKEGIMNGVEKIYNVQGLLIFDAKIKNNYYEGIQHFYHTNGKIHCIRNYKYGMLWEETVLKDRNGNDLEKGTISEGKGTLILYSEFGAKIMVNTYNRGMKNGKSTEYYPTGKLKREFNCINDTINGIEKSYDEEGRLQWESKVIKGNYSGSMKFYYPNGSLWGEHQMKNGLVWNSISLVDTTGKTMDFGNFKDGNGLLINYTDSCVKNFSSEYKDGIRNGVTKEYYTNGNLKAEYTFKDGVMEGLEKEYNEKGILISETNYLHGTLDGIRKVFHFNGTLFHEIFYISNLPWNVLSMADSSGRNLDFGEFKNGTGILKFYSDSGHYNGYGTFLNGLYEGKSVLYYPNGKIKEELNLVNDTMEGIQKTYWENGTLKSVDFKVKGLTEGLWTAYHSNGVLWTRRTYVSGIVYNVELNNDMKGNPRDKGTLKDGTGTMIRYDENEKIIHVFNMVNGVELNPPCLIPW